MPHRLALLVAKFLLLSSRRLLVHNQQALCGSFILLCSWPLRVNKSSYFVNLNNVNFFSLNNCKSACPQPFIAYFSPCHGLQLRCLGHPTVDVTSDIIETITSAIFKLEQLSTHKHYAEQQEPLKQFAHLQSEFILTIKDLRHAQAMSPNEHNTNIQLPHIQELVLHCFHYVRILAFALQCLENRTPDLTELRDVRASVMHLIEAGWIG